MDEEEVELITVVATCHSDGCGNSGIGIPLDVPSADILVLCGVCSKKITDVSDTPTETAPVE